ncbi:dermonecrotic toxin domain-containing protein [Pseudomonas syringae]|uniref:dermonecrotic toxin domain-containing protein n=1 Tax=Pseudomonas syringae TaxID=317 RepID=UPI003F74AE3E
MNLPLTASPPLPDNPPASETYPPTFSQVTLELARDLLHRLIPELDVQTTSLSYRDSQAASDDGNLINAPLIPSLVEYFTGHLNWAHSDVQGLYPSPSSTSQTPAIPLLDGAATTLFYNQINQQLEPFYRQKLADYWSAATDGGDTRRSQFIAEQIECLKSECVVLIALEKMTTNHYSLLSQALRPCDTSLAANIADIQAHSVYSLSARTGEGPPVSLYGAFVIARRLRDEPVRIDEEEREDVLLFTPHEGLQAFASLKQLHETLVKRGSVLEYGQSLGTEQVNQIDSNASELHWQYTLMEGDFLSLLHAGLVVRQQSIFAQAVQLARAQRMDEICFEQSLTRLPGSDVYFDNHWRLDRLDADLIQSQMPEWWKTMTPSQHQEWLDQAQRFGESIVSIRQASKDNFDQPENDSRTYLTRYIDKQLDDMLKRSSIPTAAERITLSMTYRVGTEVQEITGAPVPPATSTLQVSLRQLAHDRAHRILVEDALVVRAVDDTGAVITRLEKSAIKALVEAIEDPQHLSDYLDLHLRTSAYAQQLKKLQKAMLEAQMKMALLELEQQAFAPLGREWIKAVLDSPAPQGRPTVNGEAIEVRFFSVSQFKMTNVMLIAPAGKFEKGPLVLCTLDASDGVVFRWFNSMYHLTTRFLEERPFQQYLIQQIPVSRRLETLNAMQYEKEAKHWRPPEVFTQLTLLPIPSRLLHPVVFVSQSKDIYEENHETKINHLINEAKRQMSQATGRGQSARGFDLLAGIAILFLPDPIMLPVSLGVGLYKTWSAFSKVDENDLEGAAEEFLSAISYLAIALVGHLALALKPAVSATKKPRRPHLIRRVGRDGQVQIGYLLSHSKAPRFANSKLIVTMDPKRFVAIEVEGQTCFLSRRANMFGHSRLYRVNPMDATQLVHEQEFALRSTSGTWKIVGKQIPRMSQTAIRNAQSRLASLTTHWPASLEEASSTERLAFETDYLTLAKTSNAENFSEIVAYVEGGSMDINPLLRSGVRNATTRKFLRQFHKLKAWEGTAFRATYVSSDGVACLEREVGAVFTDNGVQSASVSRANASRWSQDGFVSRNANAENQPVFFIYAPGVPKKNMFTGFLGDHVAIPPGTYVQLGATKRINGQLFAWFDAPEQLVDQTYDLYTGEPEWWV